MNRSDAMAQMQEAANALFGPKSSDSDIEKLKQKINYQTWIGSMAGSGGHIHGGMKPMTEFDTISVINVLRSFSSFADDTETMKTEKTSYHSEEWTQ